MSQVVVFVYGTLMRPYWNHRPFCQGARRIERGWLPGRLYRLPSGLPCAVVEPDTVLERGTADALADVAAQVRARGGVPPAVQEGPWVQGELITFDDAEQRLPRLDWLEGYLQEDAPYLYERVLVWARGEEGDWTPAWVYVWPRVPLDGTLLPEGRWDPGQELARLQEIDEAL